jgi:uncharacterized membrane protein YgcG
LKKFFVTIACLHPDLIPNKKVMWTPIPFDAQHLQPGFRYRAIIGILEIVVVSRGVPPLPPGFDFYPPGGVAEGPHQPPSGSGRASSSSSQPYGGGTPSASFRGGSTASGAGSWATQRGSAFLFRPLWVHRCPHSNPEWGLQGIHPSAGFYDSS